MHRIHSGIDSAWQNGQIPCMCPAYHRAQECGLGFEMKFSLRNSRWPLELPPAVRREKGDNLYCHSLSVRYGPCRMKSEKAFFNKFSNYLLIPKQPHVHDLGAEIVAEMVWPELRGRWGHVGQGWLPLHRALEWAAAKKPI